MLCIWKLPWYTGGWKRSRQGTLPAEGPGVYVLRGVLPAIKGQSCRCVNQKTRQKIQTRRYQTNVMMMSLNTIGFWNVLFLNVIFLCQTLRILVFPGFYVIFRVFKVESFRVFNLQQNPELFTVGESTMDDGWKPSKDGIRCQISWTDFDCQVEASQQGKSNAGWWIATRITQRNGWKVPWKYACPSFQVVRSKGNPCVFFSGKSRLKIFTQLTI